MTWVFCEEHDTLVHRLDDDGHLRQPHIRGGLPHMVVGWFGRVIRPHRSAKACSTCRREVNEALGLLPRAQATAVRSPYNGLPCTCPADIGPDAYARHCEACRAWASDIQRRVRGAAPAGVG